MRLPSRLRPGRSRRSSSNVGVDLAPRVSWRDLAAESLAGISARPVRLLLTTLGTTLGIAALVSTIGLAQTASGQVGEHFDAIGAQQLSVEPAPQASDSEALGTPMPWDAPERAERLVGVKAAGTFARISEGIEPGDVRAAPVVDPESSARLDLPVIAASPGLLAAVRGDVVTGRFFDRGHDERADRVAVLGVNAAEELHINRIDDQPSVYIGDDTYVVIGVIDDVVRRTELLDAVIVPNGIARARLGLTSPDELHVHTDLGAAPVVGRQAPIALDPNEPEMFRAQTPPSTGELRSRVQADVNALFLALGGVSLLVGALGIANVTLLSVLERIGEIGLRRALGATKGHIAMQFLLESAAVGLLGGLVGTALGVLVTIGVSVLRDWTPVLESGLAAVAPLLGAVIGLAAGAYPAWKASAIEPITALRSQA